MPSPSLPIRAMVIALLLTGSAWGAEPPDRPTVQAIYARLCAAAGLIHGAPELQFDDGNSRSSGAFTDFNHEPTRIVVERKALETCATFGERTHDAVAFLLGHELAHFSMGHGWGLDFQRIGDHSQVNKDMALAMANNKAYHLFETQADQKGAFYAYIAGYVPEAVADTLLQRLYGNYGWNAKMSGYPDRPVREELLRDGLMHYQEMSLALRLADHRMILGQYDEASRLYELLMGEGFRNPMLFTNAGACHLLQALAVRTDPRDRFVYPVELDLRERWRGPGSDLSMEEHLRQAEDLFLQTLLMDRDADAATADLACVHLLRNDLDGAAYWIGRHGRSNKANQRTQSVLEAILAAKRGDPARAREILQQAPVRDSWLAQGNLSVLEGKEVPAAAKILPTAPVGQEKIQGKDLLELATGFDDESKVVYRNTTLLYHGQDAGSWKMSAERMDAAEKSHWLYLAGTLRGYAGKSARGIAVGDPLEKLAKAYGTPTRTLQTLDGELHLYANEGLLFHLDRSLTVSAWTLFAEK